LEFRVKADSNPYPDMMAGAMHGVAGGVSTFARRRSMATHYNTPSPLMLLPRHPPQTTSSALLNAAQQQTTPLASQSNTAAVG
jgi:hypothetical protein